MTGDLRPTLALLAGGATLTAEQTETAFDMMLAGEAPPAQVGGLLMAMRLRGETVEQITGAARAMRARMTPVLAPAGAIDTCGTGGDVSGTVNISTAVAFVVAGCGVPVAKHGNRAASSKSGAADVLEALGVNLDMPFEMLSRTLHEEQIAFLFATRHHAAMRHVGTTRRELGVQTIFNLLGPLSNPASARRQLLGVFAPQWLTPIAEVLRALGSTRAWVVHGGDGLDELTTTTQSSVAELRDGRVTRFEVMPEQVGIARASLDDLRGGDAHENAEALRQVLHGRAGPYRDIVLLNAAAALVVADKAAGLEQGAELARRSIDSGAAASRLEALVRSSNAVFA